MYAVIYSMYVATGSAIHIVLFFYRKLAYSFTDFKCSIDHLLLCVATVSRWLFTTSFVPMNFTCYFAVYDVQELYFKI